MREALVPSTRNPTRSSSGTQSGKTSRTRESTGGHQPRRPRRRAAGDRKKTCLMTDRKQGTVQRANQTKIPELGNARDGLNAPARPRGRAGGAEAVDGNGLRDEQEAAGALRLAGTPVAQTERRGCRVGGKRGVGSPGVDARGPRHPAWGRPAGTRWCCGTGDPRGKMDHVDVTKTNPSPKGRPRL